MPQLIMAYVRAYHYPIERKNSKVCPQRRLDNLLLPIFTRLHGPGLLFKLAG